MFLLTGNNFCPASPAAKAVNAGDHIGMVDRPEPPLCLRIEGQNFVRAVDECRQVAHRVPKRTGMAQHPFGSLHDRLGRPHRSPSGVGRPRTERTKAPRFGPIWRR